MLHHWAKDDRTSCHSLVVVNQQGLSIPQWLTEAIGGSGGHLTVLPGAWSLRQKAGWLRQSARRSADLVVLHHDPFDVVPTVAFARRDGPPVALLNHADHLFWLGGSVSDVVISLRTAGSEHAAKRQFVSSNTVIPIPLVDADGQWSRRDARRRLGIPEDQVALLSVARPEKYRPCGPYDFVLTAGKILARQPGAHLYAVGESPAGIAPYLRCAVHERLHFVGSMEDPSVYRAAADVYLETFPFGSNTALLEAALSGLPVVPAYAPLFALLVANDDAVQKLIVNPRDEQEYVERVDGLIQEADRRSELGDKLRECLLVDHVGEGWLDRLADLYRQTDRLTHDPRPIPTSQCHTTDADIGLSLWHVVGDGKTYAQGTADDGLRAVLCHSAFVAKEVGDYAGARRFAWRALRHDPYRRASWRLLAVTTLGRAGRVIRRLLPLW
jgi:glycosyltransferase involved in cell wall biosynthesis